MSGMQKEARRRAPCRRVALGGCVAVALLLAPRTAYTPVPRPAASATQRRQLLGGLLAAGTAAAGPGPANADGLDLGKLYQGWLALAEGKNPLEAVAPGTRRRLRGIGRDLDSLQKDVFGKDYATILKYKPVLQKYVPLFTEYTDSTFPGDSPVGRASRVAMRYEVGKFFTSLARLDQAARKENYDDATRAFADMSLAFDRYIKAGDLYVGYDPIVSTDIFYQGSKNELKYESPVTSPPEIKDAVLLIEGPDKGRTGIMIGKELGQDGTTVLNAFIKFDGGIGEGENNLKEIKLVPYGYVAKQNAPEPSA